MTDVTNSTIVRTFAAPPEAVFDGWITPASFAAWWGGGGVEALDSVAMDARDRGLADLLRRHGGRATSLTMR